jgi:plasmid maintenance system antidote protein VapI
VRAVSGWNGVNRALLLAKVLKTTPEFWLNAQMAVDLWRAQVELKEERHGRRRSA